MTTKIMRAFEASDMQQAHRIAKVRKLPFAIAYSRYCNSTRLFAAVNLEHLREMIGHYAIMKIEKVNLGAKS